MRTVAIIQARMGSSRLPGKVLLEVAGRPILELVVERVLKAERVDSVVVATSTNVRDKAIVSFCREAGYPCFLGDEHDVLDRYYQTALLSSADVIVRITADCPLVDPGVIDQVVGALADGVFDYASNVLPPTFPDGLDVEALSASTLEKLWRETTHEQHREHVTSYITEQPHLFKSINVEHTTDLSALRWTVDHPQDIDYLRRLANFVEVRDASWLTILEAVKTNPELRQDSSGAVRDEGYHSSREQNGTGQKLYAYAKRNRIPGGTQLLSKRPELLLPDQWPAYYHKAQGASIWDLDGNHFFDLTSNGVGSCVLGYADPEVNHAVHCAVEDGSMTTLNPPQEVYLADVLCELHPWATRVRYCRTGGEAMAIAVRIARASTKKNKVIVFGYHGWSDWYLSANLSNPEALDSLLLSGLRVYGVPEQLKGTNYAFAPDKMDALEEYLNKNPEDLAAIIVEPFRGGPINEDFLRRVQLLCNKHQAVFIIDEITGGFRLCAGGSHLTLEGVQPDIAVLAKGMSNGFAMAAIIGKDQVMDIAEECFISSTYWTERIGPTAALATIAKYRRELVHEHQREVGGYFIKLLQEISSVSQIEISISGMESLIYFSFDEDPTRTYQTYFIQEMLQAGFLASLAFYPTLAHEKPLIDRYAEEATKVLKRLRSFKDVGEVEANLRGPVVHKGFRRLTQKG